MSETRRKKLLLVANVSKEHIRKFHIPFINHMRERTWQVDVACRLDEPIPECDNAFDLPCGRNPFRGGTLKSARILCDIMRRGEYDAVVCNTLTGSIVTRIARLKLGCPPPSAPPVIYINHGLHYFKGAPLHRWLLGFPTERILTPLCDVFVTINDADYEMACRTLHPHRVEKLNGIGVDISRLTSQSLTAETRRAVRESFGFDDGDTVIAYTAEINRNKNQKLLLYALKTLLRDVPAARLLLIGPEHDGGKTRRLAEKLGLSEKVTFALWRADVPKILRACDLYAASSLSEGLPVNILEAMAAHLPVTASRNRGHAAIIRDGENGYLVEKDDAEAMAARLRELCESPHLRESLAEKAASELSKYDMAGVLAAEEKIVESVVARRA